MFGGRVDEELQEDYTQVFNTLVDAKAAFNVEVSLLADVYRIERATAGKCWQEKRPYVELAAYSRSDYGDEYLECDARVVYVPRRANNA